MQNDNIFLFEKHPKPKGTCPNCNTTKSFRYYENLPREFGICDKQNKCAYKNTPTLNGLKEMGIAYETNSILFNEPVKQIVYPNPDDLSGLNNYTSVFHAFCTDVLKIPLEHLQKWNIGTSKDNKTQFIIQTLAGRQLNIKTVTFELTDDGKNCKRNKGIKPFYLKAKEGTQFKRCLVGEHLLSDKIVCVVESEKTVVIASYFYPDFDFVATGGSNGLTDEMLQVLKGREIYYLGDADIAGRNNSTIKKLKAANLKPEIIDLFPEHTDGYDLADAIIDGLNPEIKPSVKPAAKIEEQKKDTEELKQENKNVSEYERVERFISERYELRNNIVANTFEVRAKNSDSKDFEQLNENNIFRELQKNHINFSINKLKSLLGSDFLPKFDPIRNYFETLPKWDKQTDTDYILKLSGYLPVKEKDRFEIQFKKWLVRAVACSLNNIVNKQALILVHDVQNSGKSSFCRWLCPPLLTDYIAENITTDKDSLIAMCTNFLINQDEVSSMNKAEINSLKAVMSKDRFKGRLPYAAKETTLIRRANIIGSTNKTEFLIDETGSVRFLCMELSEQINFAYKTDIDINLVWSQAYSLLSDGFKYEMTAEEIKENETANAAYRISTTEQELIQAYLVKSKKDNPSALFKTATDIKQMLYEKVPNERLNIIAIGKALKILGFEREQIRPEGDSNPIKGYYLSFKA